MAERGRGRGGGRGGRRGTPIGGGLYTRRFPVPGRRGHYQTRITRASIGRVAGALREQLERTHGRLGRVGRVAVQGFQTVRRHLQAIQEHLGRPGEWHDLHTLFANTMQGLYGRMRDVEGRTAEEQEELKKKSLTEALGGAIYDRIERQQRQQQLIRMGFMQDPDYELIMKRMTGLLGPLATRKVANKFYGTDTRSRTHGGAKRYPIEGRPEYGSKFSLFGDQVVPVDARPMKYLNPRTELRQKMKIIRKFFIHIIFY